jgi:enoyl-CoA hydratase/carnithine racemase
MSEQACVSIEVRDNGVATIRINRAEAKNALNMATRQQLAAHFHAASADARVHAIVLTGGDACFVAGADIWEFATAGPIEMYLRHTEHLWDAIARCPKPIVAAVNGFALGRGCELAMHCDIIVAGETARFGQPEVKLGLMPGAGGTQRLVRAVGKFQAMRIALTGCMVRAPEALAIGMISEIVSDDRTLTRAHELAAEIAALPALAVAQSRRSCSPVRTCHSTPHWLSNERLSSFCSAPRIKRKEPPRPGKTSSQLHRTVGP